MASRVYDVVVVGAGPAGASAAAAVARTGMSVALLDAADLPRAISCGGALSRPVLRELADIPGLPVRSEITDLAISLRGGPTTLRLFEEPLLRSVDRAEFDDWLVADAVDAGADIIAPCTALYVDDFGDDVRTITTMGEFRSRVVIAADGGLGKLSRQIGVSYAREDLGLVLELDAGDLAAMWGNRVHLDFGPVPGSYGWVLPQGEHLHVGVFTNRALAKDARKYLLQLLHWQRLDWMPVLRESGRIIRHRAPDSPLAKGRIMAVGEAAGLIEPWSRDGILMGIRSGRAAGEIAAIGVIAESTPEEIARAYEDALAFDVLPEMADGELCLTAFERSPQTFFQIMDRTGAGWRAFRRVTTDDTMLARIARFGNVEGVVEDVMRETNPELFVEPEEDAAAEAEAAVVEPVEIPLLRTADGLTVASLESLAPPTVVEPVLKVVDLDAVPDDTRIADLTGDDDYYLF